MAVSIGIRELRNRTSEMIELVRKEGEVVITSHGKPVAVLRPFADTWQEELRGLLHDDHPPTDTGLLEQLAEDDALSIEDLR